MQNIQSLSTSNNNIKILPINSVEYCLVVMFIQRFCSTKVQQKFRQIVCGINDEIKKSGKVHFLSSGSRFVDSDLQNNKIRKFVLRINVTYFTDGR